MTYDPLKMLLEKVAGGECDVRNALEVLRRLPFEDLDVVKLDGHRELRNAFSEVIYCQGKEPQHVQRIVEELLRQKRNIFATRVTSDLGKQLKQECPNGDYEPVSRTFRYLVHAPSPISGKLAIVCAGTADLMVAEEAYRTAEFFGVEAHRFLDVGVAGLPRLLSIVEELRQCDVAIVIAGMEGALPSVVGGLVTIPVVAVPTSIGYGAHFSGLAPLLGMLCSCSEGILVTNIDNGFGAACAALRMLRTFVRRNDLSSSR